VSRESDILQGINSEPRPRGKLSDPWIYSLDLQDWSMTPTCTNRTPGMGSRPPPNGVWTAQSRVSGFQDRTHPDLNQGPGGGPVPTRVQT
jgi:hypothetical protein